LAQVALLSLQNLPLFPFACNARIDSAATMADYYDPFGMDEDQAAAEAATPAVAVTGSEDTGGVATKGFKRGLTSSIHQKIVDTAEWSILEIMKSDRMWYDNTCNLEDWRHRDVKFERGQNMVYVIFNRPNENNSLQDTITNGFDDAMMTLMDTPSVRVAVLTGEGRMFCAGGDPKMWQAAARRAKGEILDGDGTVGYRIKMKPFSEETTKHLALLAEKGSKSRAFRDTMAEDEYFDPTKLFAAKQWHTWTNLPCFTICLANGSAMGGGVGFASICDYVISVKKAYFTTSEVKIGVIPATISPYVAARIGAANAKRFFATAENLKADKAQDAGLVNEVVENMKEGHEKIKGMLKTLSACAPSAVRNIKTLVLTISGQPLTEAIMFYSAYQEGVNLNSSEAKAGLEAEAKGEPKPWEQDAIIPLY